MFCSNNYSNIVKVEAGDRRWFILNSDNSLANDTDYFDNFYKMYSMLLMVNIFTIT